jgi:predicted RNase H-like HicB family nuclease
MRKYDYVAWKDEGLWTVHSPSVPGVYGVGATRREAEADFIDALSELLAYLRDIGESPPKRTQVIAGVVEVG